MTNDNLEFENIEIEDIVNKEEEVEISEVAREFHSKFVSSTKKGTKASLEDMEKLLGDILPYDSSLASDIKVLAYICQTDKSGMRNTLRKFFNSKPYKKFLRNFNTIVPKIKDLEDKKDKINSNDQKELEEINEKMKEKVEEIEVEVREFLVILLLWYHFNITETDGDIDSFNPMYVLDKIKIASRNKVRLSEETKKFLKSIKMKKLTRLLGKLPDNRGPEKD
ncbi:MAG: hypothetical protein RsTaC01_0105 [Candidatus Paraimprobicoccus trichonymphae]|uniref:Uncharacterized protein n=1 Tax=Candidatus Paraimprobicoccus trichonymphae TaxID=3033793 RepID=A0AA48KZL3_9FIRM|nr:MAG: hypothetical protein RsTaC01_0105 [Candidatus Paraimprobicoccus trichonymphae]